MKRPFGFGSETRAADGCIVTFELPNGEIHVEHFAQLTYTRGPDYRRIRIKDGTSYIEQVAARADKLGAMILTISTPTTVLRDLDGTRAAIDAPSNSKYAPDTVRTPESDMLRKIGRLDLHKRPSGGQTDGSIRQVRVRRPTHTGLHARRTA